MSDNFYEKLSEKRKLLQEQDLVPDWYSTAGLQMFESKYEYETNGRSVRGQFERIAKTAAKHVKKQYPKAEAKFFEMLWKGWLSPSTPVLANMGTDRGMPVSCSGTVVEDSIDGFYKNLLEVACLTKQGFGTASDFSHIRPRGSPISIGGLANGVVPVIKEHVQAMRNVAQGTARRGAWAMYLNIDHGDFDEVWNMLMADPDDLNIGWTITQAFIDRLDKQDPESIRRYQMVMKAKMVFGKGYFFFIDKANLKRPVMYVDNGLMINNSQLCSEIMLFNDHEHTYTCVLASMNDAKFDEWKTTDAVFYATIFLDCVAEEFIQKAKSKSGLEKAVRFTEKGRALGLGQCGLHTYFMQNFMPFGSMEAHMASQAIARHINDESLRASKDMAIKLGEPEWCKGYGLRNTHRIAIAPTKSTAQIMGGLTEGIGPAPGMTFTQNGAAGDMDRIDPTFLGYIKERGLYTKKHIQEITDNQGSVQKVSWLNDEEKDVFKTAFEINQKDILRLASARAQYIDQWQSLNLFFAADEEESWVSEVHKQAFLDPNILALYYCYSQSGVQASKDECAACQ